MDNNIVDQDPITLPFPLIESNASDLARHHSQQQQQLQLLYIGSYTDIAPFRLFPYVTRFVFVDQCPDDKRKHFGFLADGKPTHQKNMYTTLRKNMRQSGFRVTNHVHKTQYLWTFHIEDVSGKREPFVLDYFVNTIFPEAMIISEINNPPHHHPSLRNAIESSYILYLCGYMPSLAFLEMLNPNIKMTVVVGRCLGLDDETSQPIRMRNVVLIASENPYHHIRRRRREHEKGEEPHTISDARFIETVWRETVEVNVL